ncbi:branched-chain amino acid ABC transporter permease [Streptomyces sp. NBC_01465]|uniref:branched-chain amino acid ABC transporter permease n=1 Tax=Streptomyces sp. NBC_01465 TaxID=2903878 RepID=UPI002E33CEFA|nr:branched-chain amino acid ABC transporter permease [Streptomyces sp. NBC_01465]
MTTTTHETTPVIPLPAAAARLATTVGALATLVSTFLAWTWTSEFPGDLTVTGYPGGLQIVTLTGALLTLLFLAAGYGTPGLRWLNPAGTNNAVLLLAVGTFATTWFTVIAIAQELGGIANLEPGGFVAAATSLITVLAALGLPLPRTTDPTANGLKKSLFPVFGTGGTPLSRPKQLPSWAEILIVAVAFALGLYIAAYGIQATSELFVGFLILAGFGVLALSRSGLSSRLSALTAKYRKVTVLAAFAAAAAFPFTQDTDEFTLLAVSILIFATVALGLNVVVGLAGLLDLGYVAFLGVGAYTAALVSGTTASTFDVHFPFWAAALTGAAASLIFGVLIGAPTLRLRGDYLAIVTLGFGEIFRIAMGNLDGSSGPNITNGPNGIPNIPDLKMFGFDFGVEHSIGGFTLGSYANYFWLMLICTALVVTIFARAGNSRIGRAWVAIREDETAATAMGINGFRVKLIAFALGATLAGLAGTVQAHVQHTVVPEMYVFAGPVPPSSAFLLAAVILGGMGTITGPLLGATLLYVIPTKLQFLNDYQLLFFGLALILLMRFRPEGLIASKRQQLEYHEADEPALPEQRLGGTTTGVTKAGA